MRPEAEVELHGRNAEMLGLITGLGGFTPRSVSDRQPGLTFGRQCSGLVPNGAARSSGWGSHTRKAEASDQVAPAEA